MVVGGGEGGGPTLSLLLEETTNETEAQQELKLQVCAAHRCAACTGVHVSVFVVCLLNDLRLLLNRNISN